MHKTKVPRTFLSALSAAIAFIATATAQDPAFLRHYAWTQDISVPGAFTAKAESGEGVRLTAQIRANGALPRIPDGSTAMLYYQTNGMEQTSWWAATATVSTLGVIEAVFPASPPGRFVFVMSVEYDSARIYAARGVLTITPSPGPAPNYLVPPVPILDFNQVVTKNAPWLTLDDLPETPEPDLSALVPWQSFHPATNQLWQGVGNVANAANNAETKAMEAMVRLKANLPNPANPGLSSLDNKPMILMGVLKQKAGADALFYPTFPDTSGGQGLNGKPLAIVRHGDGSFDVSYQPLEGMGYMQRTETPAELELYDEGSNVKTISAYDEYGYGDGGLINLWIRANDSGDDGYPDTIRFDIPKSAINNKRNNPRSIVVVDNSSPNSKLITVDFTNDGANVARIGGVSTAQVGAGQKMMFEIVGVAAVPTRGDGDGNYQYESVFSVKQF